MKNIILLAVFTVISICHSEANQEPQAVDEQPLQEQVLEGTIDATSVELSTEEIPQIKNDNKASAKQTGYTKYLIIGGIVAVVGFAVYRKQRKTKKSQPFIVERKDRLSLSDIISYARKHASEGYSSMLICRLSAMDNIKSFVVTTVLNNNGFSDVNEETTLFVCLEKDGEAKAFAVFVAEELDEKLSIAINSENMVKVNF